MYVVRLAPSGRKASVAQNGSNKASVAQNGKHRPALLLHLFTASALAVLLTACGPTQVTCAPSSCSGCCTPRGECLGPAKQSFESCGTGSPGLACHTCLPGQTCGSANRCVTALSDAGLIDDGGVPCGGLGEACCNGSSCEGAFSCFRGVCTTPTDAGAVCGRAGQPCCANSCFAGATCVGGTCVDSTPDAGVDAGLRLKPTGEACNVSTECLDGLCQVFGFPLGVCTRACTTSADCLAGSQCARNPSGNGPAKLCLVQCTSPGSSPGGCRSGYLCERNADTSGVPVCFPPCTSNTMCGVAPTCDSRGFCCGSVGAACCEGSSCAAGNACTQGYCAAAACGAVGQSCCPGSVCQGQAVCSGTACVACGGVGQACCANSVCSGSTVCASGSCQTCGGLGQPCCSDNSCTSGSCQGGTCQLHATGERCAVGTDCAGGLCIAQSGAVWPQGYCTQDCASASCATGSGCSQYVATARQLCLALCTWDGGAGGCRAGYVCDRGLLNASSTAESCISACTTAVDCGSGTGLRCEAGFCCGDRGFRCCAGNTCPVAGACQANGYCR